MKVKFSVKTSGLEEIDHKLAALANKQEVWLANEVLKDTDNFVPASGAQAGMSKSAYTEGNMVVYPGPYARYLYYGKVMKGPRHGPKYATDKNLVYSKDHHPYPQSHWFEASKAVNKDKWIAGVKKLAKEEL